MGAFFHPRADYRQVTYNDPASGPVKEDVEVPGWFVYCDNCGSFAVRPSGYEEVYHDYRTTAELSSSEKLKKIIWGNFYLPSTRMETRYATFYYRGFRCAECGTQFFIKREQLAEEDPVWTDEKQRLKERMQEDKNKWYWGPRHKLQYEYINKGEGDYTFGNSGFELEVRARKDVIFIHHYSKYDLVSSPGRLSQDWSN